MKNKIMLGLCVTSIILGLLFLITIATKQNEKFCVEIKDYNRMTAGQLLDYQMEIESSLTKILNYSKGVKTLKDEMITISRSGTVNLNFISEKLK